MGQLWEAVNKMQFSGCKEIVNDFVHGLEDILNVYSLNFG